MNASDLLQFVIEALSRQGTVAGPDAHGWHTAFCPFHLDRARPNLRFTARGFTCMACGEKGNVRKLATKVGLDASRDGSLAARIVCIYDYRDEATALLFEVVRLHSPKDFRMRRPVAGEGRDDFVWNTKGVRRVLYRLPELLSADPNDWVFVVEGEKDVDALRALGLVATTNAGGAGKWRDEYSQTLSNRKVVLIGDADDAGQAHTAKVAASLRRAGCRAVVVELPGIARGGDVSDWIAGGGGREALIALAKSVQPSNDDNDVLPRETAADLTNAHGEDGQKSQATMLVEIASALDLFRDQLNDAYAAIGIDGHRETHSVRSPGFKRWLVREFYRTEGKVPNSSSVADALSVVEAHAQFDGDERHVWHRVAEDDRGSLYLDLGTADWAAVQITSTGWNVVADPPVYFRRDRMTGALPMPAARGSLLLLRDLLNVRQENDLRRIVAWLVGVLRARGPYPVLAFVAEQGAGKSLTARILRSCLDPAPVHLRGMPREERDLVIAARANHVVGLDNVSTVPQWLSDALCRLATGAGWATRRLYTDADEEVFSESRPVIMTGIEDFVANADLLDRTLLVSLDNIPPERRKQESEILAVFTAAHPTILAGLLDAASAALRNLPNISVARLPRMADFAAWVVAAEETLPWPEGGFLAAYEQGVADANDVILEGSIVTDPLRHIVTGYAGAGWTGTSTALLAEMNGAAPEDVRRRKEWPKSARGLSGQLRRIAPTLRNVGIDVAFTRDDSAARTRLISRPRGSR